LGVFCLNDDSYSQSPVQFYGWVAQLVEQWTENPRVGGSIPPPAKLPELQDLVDVFETLLTDRFGVRQFATATQM
jgi:hypothetical protein